MALLLAVGFTPIWAFYLFCSWRHPEARRAREEDHLRVQSGLWFFPCQVGPPIPNCFNSSATQMPEPRPSRQRAARLNPIAVIRACQFSPNTTGSRHAAPSCNGHLRR